MPTTSAERVFEFTSMSTMVGAVAEFIETLPPGRRIETCQLAKSCCEALKTEAAAEFIPSDGDTRAVDLGFRRVEAGSRPFAFTNVHDLGYDTNF